MSNMRHEYCTFNTFYFLPHTGQNVLPENKFSASYG